LSLAFVSIESRDQQNIAYCRRQGLTCKWNHDLLLDFPEKWGRGSAVHSIPWRNNAPVHGGKISRSNDFGSQHDAVDAAKVNIDNMGREEKDGWRLSDDRVIGGFTQSSATLYEGLKDFNQLEEAVEQQTTEEKTTPLSLLLYDGVEHRMRRLAYKVTPNDQALPQFILLNFCSKVPIYKECTQCPGAFVSFY
jgi:hypothetical protein